MEEASSLLAVILDLDPAWWQSINAPNEDGKEAVILCMESVLVFCNSHLMMKHTNRLVFVVSHPNESRFIYPPQQTLAEEVSALESDVPTPKDGKYEQFQDMNNHISKEIKQIVASYADVSHVGPSLLAGAMTKALCYINRFDTSSLSSNFESRILIVKGAKDISSQYMPTMNSIFAAQKLNVIIDSCALLGDSGFMQQASDITGGSYFKMDDLSGLLEYMLWMFLPTTKLRSKLNLPESTQIDYRAACFCHKQLVEVGFVCSVCLSIYCKFLPKCITCQSRFKLPALRTGSKLKKKKKEA